MQYLSKLFIFIIFSLAIIHQTHAYGCQDSCMRPTDKEYSAYPSSAPYCGPRCQLNHSSSYTYQIDNVCVDFCIDYHHTLEQCEQACAN